ncbi:SDR family oxidoreductase [Nocardioides endophyticus]|uniref:dTDP-4-dehydrorhamnose reductase n=2 Tax=Nocardioides endophyticus TaxID=1353775 RepID=A0ABP8Z838_9ACTN
MLGHALLHELTAVLPDAAVHGTVRSLDGLPAPFLERFADRLVPGVDVLSYDTVQAAIERYRPTVVINAVGVIKQAPGVDDHVITTEINALLPHLLARSCTAAGARLVQISTDCVFSGRTGRYIEDDVPDPVDFYGRSKLLGEVGAPHVTLRTSIIGHEMRYGGSLIEWFLSQRGQHVHGFTKAIYSGLPTVELAHVIAHQVLPRPEITGLWHVASAAISKFDLLQLVAAEYGWEGEVSPADTLVCDRSLSAGRFADATGYTAPSWPELVHEMRVSHERWNQG